MRKTKRNNLFVLLCICLSVTLCACSKDTLDKNAVSYTKAMDQFNNIKIKDNDIDELLSYENEIKSTASIYNITYSCNSDRKMYVFSSRVRENANGEYVTINKDLTANENNEYELCNNTYKAQFTKDAINIKNDACSVSILPQINFDDMSSKVCTGVYGLPQKSIIYKTNTIELCCIPTNLGIALEIIYLEKPTGSLNLKLDISGFRFINDSAGYVKIRKDENDVAVIYSDFSVDSQNNIYYNEPLNVKRDSGNLILCINTENWDNELVCYPVKSILHLDLYEDKMFFDTSVYQNIPEQNTILNNISIFDESHTNNSGYTYVKCNLDSITPKNQSMLKSILYNFYVVALSNSIELEAYLVTDEWCSYTINWNNKPPYAEKIGDVFIDKTGYCQLNITEFAKRYIEHSTDYSAECCFLLRVKDEDFGIAVIASADNTLVPPFFEVNYSVEE